MTGFLRRYSGMISAALLLAVFAHGEANTGRAAPGADDRVYLTSHAIRAAALFKQEPEYPAAARQFRLGGEVVVECTVSLEGKVENVTVKTGQPLLNDAVVRAVRKWTFAPYMVDGHPRRVKSTLVFDFKL
jgi:periplasmic protein TonB